MRTIVLTLVLALAGGAALGIGVVLVLAWLAHMHGNTTDRQPR